MHVTDYHNQLAGAVVLQLLQDPEMLLPWQRDVTTFPLYWQCFEDILGGGL